MLFIFLLKNPTYTLSPNPKHKNNNLETNSILKEKTIIFPAALIAGGIGYSINKNSNTDQKTNNILTDVKSLQKDLEKNNQSNKAHLEEVKKIVEKITRLESSASETSSNRREIDFLKNDLIAKLSVIAQAQQSSNQTTDPKVIEEITKAITAISSNGNNNDTLIKEIKNIVAKMGNIKVKVDMSDVSKQPSTASHVQQVITNDIDTKPIADVFDKSIDTAKENANKITESFKEALNNVVQSNKESLSTCNQHMNSLVTAITDSSDALIKSTNLNYTNVINELKESNKKLSEESKNKEESVKVVIAENKQLIAENKQLIAENQKHNANILENLKELYKHHSKGNVETNSNDVEIEKMRIQEEREKRKKEEESIEEFKKIIDEEILIIQSEIDKEDKVIENNKDIQYYINEIVSLAKKIESNIEKERKKTSEMGQLSKEKKEEKGYILSRLSNKYDTYNEVINKKIKDIVNIVSRSLKEAFDEKISEISNNKNINPEKAIEQLEEQKLQLLILSKSIQVNETAKDMFVLFDKQYSVNIEAAITKQKKLIEIIEREIKSIKQGIEAEINVVYSKNEIQGVINGLLAIDIKAISEEYAKKMNKENKDIMDNDRFKNAMDYLVVDYENRLRLQQKELENVNNSVLAMIKEKLELKNEGINNIEGILTFISNDHNKVSSIQISEMLKNIEIDSILKSTDSLKIRELIQYTMKVFEDKANNILSKSIEKLSEQKYLMNTYETWINLFKSVNSQDKLIMFYDGFIGIIKGMSTMSDIQDISTYFQIAQGKLVQSNTKNLTVTETFENNNEKEIFEKEYEVIKGVPFFDLIKLVAEIIPAIVKEAIGSLTKFHDKLDTEIEKLSCKKEQIEFLCNNSSQLLDKKELKGLSMAYTEQEDGDSDIEENHMQKSEEIEEVKHNQVIPINIQSSKELVFNIINFNPANLQAEAFKTEAELLNCKLQKTEYTKTESNIKAKAIEILNITISLLDKFIGFVKEGKERDKPEHFEKIFYALDDIFNNIKNNELNFKEDKQLVGNLTTLRYHDNDKCNVAKLEILTFKSHVLLEQVNIAEKEKDEKKLQSIIGNLIRLSEDADSFYNTLDKNNNKGIKEYLTQEIMNEIKVILHNFLDVKIESFETRIKLVNNVQLINTLTKLTFNIANDSIAESKGGVEEVLSKIIDPMTTILNQTEQAIKNTDISKLNILFEVREEVNLTQIKNPIKIMDNSSCKEISEYIKYINRICEIRSKEISILKKKESLELWNFILLQKSLSVLLNTTFEKIINYNHNGNTVYDHEYNNIYYDKNQSCYFLSIHNSSSKEHRTGYLRFMLPNIALELNNIDSIVSILSYTYNDNKNKRCNENLIALAYLIFFSEFKISYLIECVYSSRDRDYMMSRQSGFVLSLPRKITDMLDLKRGDGIANWSYDKDKELYSCDHFTEFDNTQVTIQIFKYLDEYKFFSETVSEKINIDIAKLLDKKKDEKKDEKKILKEKMIKLYKQFSKCVIIT